MAVRRVEDYVGNSRHWSYMEQAVMKRRFEVLAMSVGEAWKLVRRKDAFYTQVLAHHEWKEPLF